MKAFKGCDELREWLVENGFKIFYHDRGAEADCHWYAARHTKLPARECEANECVPMEIRVRPYWFHDSKYTRVEVELFGKVDGMWFNLNCYSPKQNELPEKLDAVERMLIAAWNALEVKK